MRFRRLKIEKWIPLKALFVCRFPLITKPKREDYNAFSWTILNYLFQWNLGTYGNWKLCRTWRETKKYLF
jgi:hypothetical protein